ncbi:MAG: hypothetical protein C0401_06475 [Anaerolinea sp.]|nr:hypothetical protein [Anaerolinea sp.]
MLQPTKPPSLILQNILHMKPQRLAAFVLVFFMLGSTIYGMAADIIKNGAQKPTPTTFPTQTQLPPTFTPRPTLTATITLVPTDTTTPTITFTPTLTFTPTMTFTPTLTLPAAAGAQCVPAENERVKARVVRITDGDTIVVNIDGTEYKLRYIGVDAPESNASGGGQSTAYNRALVEGKTVTLVKDVSEVDRYDRLLRYVFAGDVFVNYEMARAGFSTSGTWPPDTSCDQTLANAEATARSNKLGLWAPTVTLKPYIPPASTKPAPSGNCSPAYPSVCIPPAPPDLDCKDVPFKRFKVLPPDPHNFDRDGDGIGCES